MSLRKQVKVDGVEYIAHRKKDRKNAFECDGCVFQKYDRKKFDCALHTVSDFCVDMAEKGYRVWFEKKHKA